MGYHMPMHNPQDLRPESPEFAAAPLSLEPCPLKVERRKVSQKAIGARLYIIIDKPGPPRGVETPSGPPGAAPLLNINIDSSGEKWRVG